MLRAPLRHAKVTIGTFLLPTALGIVAALFVTPLYTASAVLVTTLDALTTSVGEQETAHQEGDLISVWEAVKGRDNLVKLARRTHLTEKIVYGTPLTEEDKLQQAVKMLEFRLNIKIDDNTIAFIADWTDAQTAFDLAQGAVLNFVETHEGYRTLKPAEVPRKPKYPVRVILVLGGAVLGLLMSIGISAALHLASRR